MSQDWPVFDFSSGADTVKLAIEGLRDRTNDLRSANNGSTEPIADLYVGMLWWNTNTNDLKILESLSPSVWKAIPVEGDQLDDTWLLADAVTTVKILDGAVTGPKIGTSAVLEASINASAVTVNKIGTGAVTAPKIGALAVGTAALAANAVTSGKITDANVTTAKIADDAVTVDKLGPGAVNTTAILDGSITSPKLSAGLSLLWTCVDKSGDYAAVNGNFVVATMGASWTLTLPATPAANDRVGIYVDSVTGSFELTVYGGVKVIGQQGTSMKLYVAGERLELVYSGSKWLVLGANVVAHHCQMTKTGMTRAAPGSSFEKIAYDGKVFDRGQIGDAVTNNRIDIRRTGTYRVTLQALFGQLNPTGWVFLVKKNGVVLSPRMAFPNVSDYYADYTLDSVGPEWSRVYGLTAGDYIEAEFYSYLATGDNQSRLTVEELPFIV